MRRLGAITALVILAGLLAPAPARAQETVTITGGGWGHGIGMSQYGAYGRALNGRNAVQILTHYYTNARVRRRDMPGNIRVGLLQGRNSISLSSSAVRDGGGDVVWRERGRGRIARGGPSVTWKVEPSPTGGMRLFRNGNPVSRDGRVVFGGSNRPLVLTYARHGSRVDVNGKNSYRHGRMNFGTHSGCGGNCVRLVVALPMQKYLYGLSEVPSSWPQAVLRAQAMAGRTYAFEKMTRSSTLRQPCDCHVLDSVADQAYTGDGKRVSSGSFWAAWKGAVDGTNRRVILHNGNPIQALYSSSSGGHTEHNENIWGTGTSSSAIPYLRGVPDKQDRARGNNPNHTWKEEMSYSQFESKLNAAYGTGKLQRFEFVPPRGVSRRVTVVRPDNTGGARIVGSNKTHRASGWSLRSALGIKDSLFWVEISQEVGTAFRNKYDQLNGAPGEPTSAPYTVPRGAANSKGRAQDFEKGRMVRNRAAGRVTWQWGPVLRRYTRLGRERSVLGLPMTDVLGPGPNRHLRANYDRGLIVFSNDTGPRTVLQRFRDAYRRNGLVNGPLGLPVTPRQGADTLPRNGRRQLFQSGALYRNPDLKDVFALWGRIGSRYRNMGEASGRCGYPIADMAAGTDTAAATFQNGTITWAEGSGVGVSCPSS